MDEETVSTDLRLKPRDWLRAALFSMVVIAVTAVTVSSFVEQPPEAPVARVTTEDLRAMADLARAIQQNPRSTPAQVRTADRLAEVVEAVENGEVEIVPNTTRPPTTTTTTTTTTTVPPTTAAPLGSRPNPAPWPGDPITTVPPLIDG